MAVREMHAPGGDDAHIVCAFVPVVAIGWYAPGARTARALVVLGTHVAVIAEVGVGGKNATSHWITCIIGTRVAVITRQCGG